MPDGTDQLFILLGANLGNRAETFARTRVEILARVGIIRSQSALYESPAWGVAEQPPYLNQVLQITTTLSPEAVLSEAQAIETALGRVRHERWGSRRIDIDLLFFGNAIRQTDALTLPHPLLHLRRFTLVPLAEVTPDFQHPVLGKTTRELLADCSDLVTPTRLSSL